MPVQFYIMLAIIVPLLVLVVILSSKEKNLNSIKAKTVGDGQHGKARFATKRRLLRHTLLQPLLLTCGDREKICRIQRTLES